MVHPHLAQHVILLHVVDLPRAYFPFERILKELPADVNQQGCKRPVLLRAAERLVMATGRGSPISQDDPNYESWKRVKNPWGWFATPVPNFLVSNNIQGIMYEPYKRTCIINILQWIVTISFLQRKRGPEHIKTTNGFTKSGICLKWLTKCSISRLSSSQSFTPLMCKPQEAKH